MKVNDIIKYIEQMFPLQSAFEYDNSGANILFNNDVKKILVCLDITKNSIDYAIRNNANLIISHHPIIFNPIKNICDDTLSKKIKLLIRNQISAYSCHTNFDVNMKYGMAKIIIEKLFKKSDIKKHDFLENITVDNKKYGIGNIITLKNKIDSFDLFLSLLNKFDIPVEQGSIFAADDKTVKKVILIPGSGSSDVDRVIREGCDCLITSDLKHNQIVDLLDNNITYINLTHYGLEKEFVNQMSSLLIKKFKNVLTLI